jgi:hypothetical protein
MSEIFPLAHSRRQPDEEVLASVAVAPMTEETAAALTNLIQSLATEARRREADLDWTRAIVRTTYDANMLHDRIMLQAPVRKGMKRL